MALDKFEHEFKALEQAETNLLQIRDDFEKSLVQLAQQEINLANKNPLAEVNSQLKSAIAQAVSNWGQQWRESSAMRELSQTYADRVILLVFGKVNAGKSSFSNYLASCFPERDVKYFCFDNGEVQYHKQSFAEGVTETTATIQGIELGNKLVLLDSPGLHSVTDENGQLTRVFTDSADLVLWLTPSTSPGQVQELDDLKAELESQKPLFPVITRSDVIEEDVNDEGEIVSEYRNKSAENRQLQEQDVQTRAHEKLSNDVKLNQPVSISVMCYRKSLRTEQDMHECGLHDLLENIALTIDKARNYKGKKARQQVVNYLERQVMSGVKADLTPKLHTLKAQIENQKKELTEHQDNVQRELALQLGEFIPDWAESYKEQRDTGKLAKKIQSHIQLEIQRQLAKLVERFIGDVEPVIVSIGQDQLGSYQDINITYEQKSGAPVRAGASGAIAIGGTALGTAFFGPVGGLVGGVIGGVIGDVAGSFFESTETIEQTVGVSTQEVSQKALAYSEKILPRVIEQTFKGWQAALVDMEQYCFEFESEIGHLAAQITEQREKL